MSYFTDLRDEILAQANKTGDTNKDIVEGKLVGVIQNVNQQLDSSVVKARDTVSVAALEKSTDMPAKCKRIIRMGKWDATNERIINPFTEISERQMENIYAGDSTIESDPDPWLYHLLDDTSTGEKRVRILPPPSDSFTLGVRYFESLTKDNAHRLENDELLKNGAIAALSTWFPTAWQAALRLYGIQINDTRASWASINRQFRMRQNPKVRRRNRQALIIK